MTIEEWLESLTDRGVSTKNPTASTLPSDQKSKECTDMGRSAILGIWGCGDHFQG